MRTLQCLGLSLIAAAPVVAELVSPVAIFGKKYRVDRFDYSQEVTFADPINPGETAFLVEAEGLHFLGGNALLFSSDAFDSLSPATTRNLILEVEVNEDPQGFPSGLSFVRIAVAKDYDPLDANDYSLGASGVTINTGSTGIAPGGILISDNEEDDGTGRAVRGYVLTSASPGPQVEWPVGSGCLGVNNGKDCGIDITSTTSEGGEDLTYVPLNGGRIFVIEDNIYEVDVFDVNGNYLAGESFFVGQSLGTPGVGEGKGITYSANSAKLPLGLQNPNGVVVVAFDDEGPALQAFEVDGTLIQTAYLTDDGTTLGTSLLDLDDCPNQLQLESLAIDPATGRWFLNNQSDFTDCAYLFVLTPTCNADIDGNGNVNDSDLGLLLNDFGLIRSSPADINNSGNVDDSDLGLLLNEFGDNCQQ